MRKPCSKKLRKNSHDEIFIIYKNENLEISSIKSVSSLCERELLNKLPKT